MGRVLQLLRCRWVWIGLLVFSFFLGGTVFFLGEMGVDLEALKAGWKQVNDYLMKHPWALFAALVFLTGLPVPLTALLFAAGVVWREDPMMAVGLSVFAMSLNLTWTYWLAAGPARRLVEKLLLASSFTIPDLPRGDHLKLILVLKLTPGIPFFIQNYLLGFLRAPFWMYLWVSCLINGITGAGVVLSGVGLADGKWMPALTGLSLIALGVVFSQLAREFLRRKKLRLEKMQKGDSCISA